MGSGLCECGCGGVTSIARQTETKRGLVKGQHVRFLPHHHVRIPGYIVDADTACWNWTGHLKKGGRAGLKWRNGIQVSAYVAYYEEARGPIPVGLVLDHLCRNPRCVNPYHLEAVTQAVNIRRRSGLKLTKESAADIRRLRGSATAVELGKLFGVSYQHVNGIWQGLKWRDAEAPHRRGRA